MSKTGKSEYSGSESEQETVKMSDRDQKRKYPDNHITAGTNSDPVTADAIAYIQELFRTDAGGHDAGHTLRVWRNAMYIADRIPSCDRQRVSLAALLHDADDHKLFDTKNNANARAFLQKHRVPDGTIEQICADINSVSFSKNQGRRPETIEGRIVQDADRLDAMGAVGIARTFAFGGEHGRSLEESVRHFYDKLLLLKDLMNTDAGRELAGKRHAFLEAFLREYLEETDTGTAGESCAMKNKSGNPEGTDQ